MSWITRGGKTNVAGGIPGVALRQRVTLTSAQILALNTTPATLLAAPGVGMYHSIDEIVFKAPVAGSVAYTGANAVEIRYTNGSGPKLTGDVAAATLNSITGVVDKTVGAAVSGAVANSAVVASVPVANPAAGNGTVTLDILYRTVSI